MKNLKKYLISLFVAITVAMAFINSAIDSIFDTLAAKITDSNVMSLVFLLYILITILVFVLGTVIFVRKTSKRVEQENIRYTKERNMLFANISHDIKTPITTIIGFSKALHDDVVNEEEKKELLSSIYEKSKKVNELLDLMFQYTKLDGVDFEMKLQEIEVGRIIKDITALYYNEFEERNMEINIEIPEEPIKRNLDKVEFSRAISNLIINAYRHNRAGSKIAISLKEEGCIKIIVADNGENINPKMKENIFDPFVCEDESRNSKGGSGLGLAITKKIIERHGGKIYIDSKIEGYTKGFVIEL